MRLHNKFLSLLFIGVALIHQNEARRIRVQPQEQEEETIQYYSAEPRDTDREDRVVYISSADQYNGLYGQPSASSRSSQDNYIPSSRNSLNTKSRTKEAPKTPPVQTIRNYNKVNDDGSFTFGYEAADGSFKEETRGTDCVVRGKYGYVDPDGNKREFTYVSGNPCDPNAPKEDQDDKPEEEDSDEPENIPANYPIRPIRPISTPAPKPVISVFQNNYAREEEEPEPEQVLKSQPIQPVRTRPPVFIPRTQYIPEPQTEAPQIYRRPSQIYTTIPSTTPASVIYKNTITPLSITPRPTPRPLQPITTYRPQTLQLSVTPRPALLYTKPISTRPIITTPSPFTTNRGNLNFDAEFLKFQQENNVLAPTPTTSIPKAITKAKPSPTTSTGQVYSSELIFDPSSGQYNTQLYQALPQTTGEFSLSQKIQPYVHQPDRQVVNIQQLQQQSPLYRQQARPQANQALYQQQQAELQFQNSAQLFAQQEKARQQQQQQQQQQQLQQPTAPQQYYYIQPSALQQQSGYTNGQIDAFLRGHNIQF